MSDRDFRVTIEDILGRDLVVDGVVAVTERSSSYTRESGNVSTQWIGPADNLHSCLNAGILDVAGISRTRADGSKRVELADYFCDWNHTDVTEFEHPVNVVATARTDRAIFVTFAPTLRENKVYLEFWTWNHDGSEAPNTTVHWRCQVPYHERIG